MRVEESIHHGERAAQGVEKRREVMRETHEGVGRTREMIWRTLMKTWRGKTVYFEMNARVALMRNWVWKEEENEWKRALKSSKVTWIRKTQASGRVLAKDIRNSSSVTNGNLNEERRNGRVREGKIRKIETKSYWKTEISRRENAQTWRKNHLSMNQLRGNHWRTEMNFLRERTISIRKTLNVLKAKRRGIQRKITKSWRKREDDLRRFDLELDHWRGMMNVNRVEKQRDWDEKVRNWEVKRNGSGRKMMKIVRIGWTS